MTAMAVIVDVSEVERLLRHLGLPAEFPKTRPWRGPPKGSMDEDGQMDPGLDDWDGKEQAPTDD